MCLDDGVPVTCTFVRTDMNQAVVGFSSSSSVLYDIETGQQIVRFTPPSDTPRKLLPWLKNSNVYKILYVTEHFLKDFG